jgi:threonylcarbamoyladenosine tRNA methylthiotransferase MtaB
MNKRIAFITLGCKLNYAETSTYERELLKAGFEAVPWSKGADVFVVNTCTVTEHSDKKSRNIIRKLHRQNPEALIYVTGCSAQLRRND